MHPSGVLSTICSSLQCHVKGNQQLLIQNFLSRMKMLLLRCDMYSTWKKVAEEPSLAGTQFKGNHREKLITAGSEFHSTLSLPPVGKMLWPQGLGVVRDVTWIYILLYTAYWFCFLCSWVRTGCSFPFFGNCSFNWNLKRFESWVLYGFLHYQTFSFDVASLFYLAN